MFLGHFWVFSVILGLSWHLSGPFWCCFDHTLDFGAFQWDWFCPFWAILDAFTAVSRCVSVILRFFDVVLGCSKQKQLQLYDRWTGYGAPPRPRCLCSQRVSMVEAGGGPWVVSWGGGPTLKKVKSSYTWKKITSRDEFKQHFYEGIRSNSNTPDIADSSCQILRELQRSRKLVLLKKPVKIDVWVYGNVQ